MSLHLNILGKKTRHWRKESLGPILVASMQAFKRGKGLLAGIVPVPKSVGSGPWKGNILSAVVCIRQSLWVT